MDVLKLKDKNGNIRNLDKKIKTIEELIYRYGKSKNDREWIHVLINSAKFFSRSDLELAETIVRQKYRYFKKPEKI